MRTIKFLSLLLIGYSVQAQDLNQAKQAIDAEKYHQAKSILKNLIQTNSDKGENYFYLADIYLIQKENDSAAMYLNQGLKAKSNAHLNYVGLGHIDLNKNNLQGAAVNFNKALENIKKRDVEELIQVGRAYLNSDNADPKKAIEYLTQAKQADPKSAVVLLYLGDAHLADKNTNEAFKAYRDAQSLDKDLKRATLQMAVITKNAKAFEEAVSSFNQIAAKDPNYGPVYRELAETYYYWGSDNLKKYKEYNQKALDYYRKYMSLTDSSLDSKMRYADFLILTKEYTTLEQEAQKMMASGEVNPRIYRYLGYAAFENKNYQESINALTTFLQKGNKIIGRDYLMLAKAKLALAKKDGVISDVAKFDEALKDLEDAVVKDPYAGSEFNQLGEELYKEKLYEAAAKVFALAIKDQSSSTYALDNLYLGNAILFHTSSLQAEVEKFTPEQKADYIAQLQKADEAYAEVIKTYPTTHDAHLNKAKINRMIETEEALDKAVISYEDYIRIVNEKGETELSKERTKRELVGAHTFLGSRYTAKNDKAKALEHFQKALSFNPTEEITKYINQSINVLKR